MAHAAAPSLSAASDRSLALYPRFPEAIPEGEMADGSYAVRFARSAAELDELLRLRFRVFNLELGEGLAASWETGRDLDPFDAQCHHLIVEHQPSGHIIGTYRVQTTEMARAGDGLYTATEFDLAGLPDEIVDRAVEVGRACIEREHRLKPVLFLLWRGLARYMAHNRRRWLLGPCSLTSQDPWDGKRALDLLARRGRLATELELRARPGYECVWEGEDPEPDREAFELPPLFEIYLRYGARVIGPPVIDRQFGTLDFFILFDVEALSDRSRRLFFG